MATWLLDTDVLIDVALDRQPHAGPSRSVIELLQTRQGESLFVAWHTVSNLYYNAYDLRRPRDASFARAAVSGLLEYAQVAPTTTDDVRYALTLPLDDFEDAMQVAAARACNARFIVTRNVRDYAQSPIPVLTPANALAELSG